MFSSGTCNDTSHRHYTVMQRPSASKTVHWTVKIAQCTKSRYLETKKSKKNLRGGGAPRSASPKPSHFPSPKLAVSRIDAEFDHVCVLRWWRRCWCGQAGLNVTMFVWSRTNWDQSSTWPSTHEEPQRTSGPTGVSCTRGPQGSTTSRPSTDTTVGLALKSNQIKFIFQ